ncbi:hypothetical protein [Runella salmonicolor]|uniref:Uncharacterized protein n=1 Tax=Runella salmonicolor TaxID=2950278 RepID=A0ABT1FT01_9BACT|nr:hypothetical protein [Runella salmonicolor]MCP1384832.1 hypothetical protein [Runella salmonicolor]
MKGKLKKFKWPQRVKVTADNIEQHRDYLGELYPYLKALFERREPIKEFDFCWNPFEKGQFYLYSMK